MPEEGENPDVEPITKLDMSRIVTTYLAQEQVWDELIQLLFMLIVLLFNVVCIPLITAVQIDEAKKERNKAILSKEDYKARCKSAEEKLKDMKADKEAVKKSLTRKIMKLKKDLDTMKETAGLNDFLISGPCSLDELFLRR